MTALDREQVQSKITAIEIGCGVTSPESQTAGSSGPSNGGTIRIRGGGVWRSIENASAVTRRNPQCSAGRVGLWGCIE